MLQHGLGHERNLQLLRVNSARVQGLLAKRAETSRPNWYLPGRLHASRFQCSSIALSFSGAVCFVWRCVFASVATVKRITSSQGMKDSHLQKFQHFAVFCVFLSVLPIFSRFVYFFAKHFVTIIKKKMGLK